jgi:hypothetical protein
METITSTNEINEFNDFSVSELNYIRESIENMNKFNQVEVLRILNKYPEITLNENKYGTHINLSDIKKEVIFDLQNYIKYVNTQENTLNQIEKEKEKFKTTYFTKDIKDNLKK